jgi:hypothetical protein
MTTISDFKAQLRQGGARSNQFTVELTFPAIANANGAARAASFLCNATTLPAVTVANIPLVYRGRPVNFAGEREFAAWSITVINDGDFLIRNAFENWSNAIANFNATNGLQNPLDYQVDMRVIQLDRNGAQLKAYKFKDAYPTEIGSIGLSYANPEIQTFEVTFQYNFYEPENVGGGLGVNIQI